MELLADRDPEEARQLLDPVLERMMEAVHHYEGTVNQVMGDGIMALFGAPLAHEDHALRACYAALRMQERVRRYGDEMQRTHGVPVQIRVGLNSGDVVVRAIGSDLHMDYTAVGQTTHLAARMEQMAKPGSVLLTAATLRLVEGYVRVRSLGPVSGQGARRARGGVRAHRRRARRERGCRSPAARGLTRFIGRDAELEQLRVALERARAGAWPGRRARRRARRRQVSPRLGAGALAPDGTAGSCSSRAPSPTARRRRFLPVDRAAQAPTSASRIGTMRDACARS